ncbi:hypothetical protein HGG74_12535 [Arthrobacter sp. E918]|uniref:Uncharacterized protein n=1 Tax=Arthrobacter mobilis TaxID=2724944 RepID=A0A7X6HE70_9MICC|nr:hypothetical protein [Arthrobacter mobilis]
MLSIIEGTAAAESAACLRTVTDPGRRLSRGTGGWAGFDTAGTGTDTCAKELGEDINAR